MLIEPMAAADFRGVQAIAELCQTRVDLDAEIRRDWGLVWVAREGADEEPIAFLIAWRAADEMHVIDLGTHPRRRRRGAARALLGRLISHARTLGSSLMVLEVRQSNRPAIRLYQSLGFVVARVRRSYYADAGEDGLEMVLKLDGLAQNGSGVADTAAVK
jgi:ribosomal protein S18 acetylase RimI-like enzyme